MLRLWSTYDKNDNGVLDPQELETLLRDLFQMMAQQEALVTLYVHNMFTGVEDEAQHETLEEAEELLRALLEELSANSDQVAAEIVQRLDVNHDGQIQRKEFVSLFGLWLQMRMEQALSSLLT